MSITGPGSITAVTVAAQNSMMNQLNTLSEELGTGDAAQTYSGLESQAGLAVQLSAQIAELTGYSDTNNALSTTLTLAQSVLSQISSVGTDVAQSLSDQSAFSLNDDGQTATQQSAASYLDQILSLLNTQDGNNYLFSGSASDQPSVASASEILNGNGTQAGLTQIIAERLQADQGSDGLGRLDIPAASGSTVTVSQELADGTFGFQLSGVTSNLTGATVTGPSGSSPPSISVDLGSNPNSGDTIEFDLTLPDGSSQTITLQATTDSPPGADQFTIGDTAADTAANLQTALTTAVSDLAQTALPAASAIAASTGFFQDPPQIVDGPPYDTATSLTDGTTANTVFWYTGENSSTPALQTATAQVSPTTTISYGMSANEPAITSLLANVAALAATTYSSSDTNAEASYEALSNEVEQNLSSTQSGTQSISDIEASLADAQTTLSNATTMNTQTQSTLEDMLQGIEGTNQTQIGEDILTLQNNLSASMSASVRLAQMSLVNYLSSVSG